MAAANERFDSPKALGIDCDFRREDEWSIVFERQ